jgi:hypothetical protein
MNIDTRSSSCVAACAAWADDAHGLCRDSSGTRRRDRVKLRLWVGFGGGPLGLQLSDPLECFRLGVLSLRLGLVSAK